MLILVCLLNYLHSWMNFYYFAVVMASRCVLTPVATAPMVRDHCNQKNWYHMDLTSLQQQLQCPDLAPVEMANRHFVWFTIADYRWSLVLSGSEILRQPMVRLFASVLTCQRHTYLQPGEYGSRLKMRLLWPVRHRKWAFITLNAKYWWCRSVTPRIHYACKHLNNNSYHILHYGAVYLPACEILITQLIEQVAGRLSWWCPPFQLGCAIIHLAWVILLIMLFIQK
jgi:hypothetical protein